MSAPRQVALLTVVLKIKISSVHDDVRGTMPLHGEFEYKASFCPEKFTAVPNREAKRVDTNYVLQKGAIESTVFSLMPKEAASDRIGQSVTGRQCDLEGEFIKQIGFSDLRSFGLNGVHNQTVTETFFDVRQPSRGGAGVAAQTMTPEDVAGILQVGRVTRFFIFHRVYSVPETRTTYEGTAEIISVSRDDGTSV